MYFSKCKFKNWKKNYPSNILEYILTPSSWGVKCANFIFQKIFKINGKVPFMVHYTSIVSGKITIGKEVVRYFANSNCCYIQGINGIEIGDNSMFASGVKIISANHNKVDYNKHDKANPIKIGNNCWIGTNVVILPEVCLGDNVIVAAGSVVSKSFGSNLIIGGVPAKILKENI
jgi:acetyltransferase-like isoleucine patch superfamily enzyme